MSTLSLPKALAVRVFARAIHDVLHRTEPALTKAQLVSELDPGRPELFDDAANYAVQAGWVKREEGRFSV